MGIDRIGKGGSVAPPADVGGARPNEATRPFDAKRADKAAAPDAIAATSPLEKLRAGQIDLNGYLDMKVEAATSHLHGLRASELDAIKRALRAQMASDPALADLVKQATGSAPEPRDD